MFLILRALEMRLKADYDVGAPQRMPLNMEIIAYENPPGFPISLYIAAEIVCDPFCYGRVRSIRHYNPGL